MDLWPPCSCCLLSSRCQVMPWPSDAGAVGCPRLPLLSTGTSRLNRIEKPYAQQGHKREHLRIRLIGTHQRYWSSGGGWEILYAFALTGLALPFSSGLCQTPRSLRLYLLSSPSRRTISLQAVRRVLSVQVFLAQPPRAWVGQACSASDASQWAGITCLDGRVTSLRLSQFQSMLSGTDQRTIIFLYPCHPALCVHPKTPQVEEMQVLFDRSAITGTHELFLSDALSAQAHFRLC